MADRKRRESVSQNRPFGAASDFLGEHEFRSSPAGKVALQSRVNLEFASLCARSSHEERHLRQEESPSAGPVHPPKRNPTVEGTMHSCTLPTRCSREEFDDHASQEPLDRREEL
ncbi:hypothetical protein KM043_010209 [Ampulex compressa]|nr:hypothetical protein KM043_010209 [Ampulex compressa]